MVISGKNLDQDKSDRQQRLVSSLGQDMSYNTTNSQWMMPKQLGLGFAMQGKKFLITSPLTKVPPDLKDLGLIHHNSNKEQIIRLLLNEWKKNKYAPRLHTVKLYFALGTKCFILSSSDGKYTSCEVYDDLESEQEEADVRMITHLLNILQEKEDMSVVVRPSDNDVECLLLNYFTVYGMKGTLIMDSGVGDNRRLIDINCVAEDIGIEACCSLVGWHYYTGSDTTSALVRNYYLDYYLDFPNTAKYMGTTKKNLSIN